MLRQNDQLDLQSSSDDLLGGLPNEVILAIAEVLRPEDATRFFSTCAKFQQLKNCTEAPVNTYWDYLCKLHFPKDYLEFKKKPNKPAAYVEVDQKHYQNLSPDVAKLLSIIKQGDLESFVEGKYTLEDLLNEDQGGLSVSAWASINHHQTMLDYFYLLAIRYYQNDAGARDINKKDSIGNSILHWAVQCNQSSDLILSLIESGIDINIKNSFGTTPLYIAACYGHLDIVKILLESGATIDAARIDGATKGSPPCLRISCRISSARRLSSDSRPRTFPWSTAEEAAIHAWRHSSRATAESSA